MTFPLEALAAAVSVRAEIWARLELRWHTRSVEPNHGNPVVSTELESSSWLVEIIIWDTGEAELATIRLADDRMVNKHYASPPRRRPSTRMEGNSFEQAV